MTIKEMLNEIDDIKYFIHRGDKEIVNRFYSSLIDEQEKIKYIETYGNAHLKKSAKKLQVEKYYNCVLEALKLLNIKIEDVINKNNAIRKEISIKITIEESLNEKVIVKLKDKIFECVVYDYNKELKKVWIETENDIYCLNFKEIEEIKKIDKIEEIRRENEFLMEMEGKEEKEEKEENNIKGNAKLEFNKYISEDFLSNSKTRELAIDLIITSDTENNVNLLFDKLSQHLEKKLNVNFSKCPDIHLENKKNKWVYIDGFNIEYLHGDMTDTKKYIKKIFKEVKKELKIK